MGYLYLYLYLKRTCSRVTSASSALGVLNDYAHSITPTPLLRRCLRVDLRVSVRECACHCGITLNNIAARLLPPACHARAGCGHDTIDTARNCEQSPNWPPLRHFYTPPRRNARLRALPIYIRFIPIIIR